MFCTATIFVVAFTCFTVTAATEQPLFWRNGASGGVNTLYVYLKSRGKHCSYAEICADQARYLTTGTCTALTVTQVASDFGVSLYVTSPSFKALSNSEFPVIAHMDGSAPNSGAFLVLLSVGDKVVYYINGPTGSIHAMKTEDFKRIWSGFIIAEHRSLLFFSFMMSVGFVIGFMGMWYASRLIGHPSDKAANPI